MMKLHNSISDEEYNVLNALFAEGFSPAEICIAHHITRAALHKLLNKPEVRKVASEFDDLNMESYRALEKHALDAYKKGVTHSDAKIALTAARDITKIVGRHKERVEVTTAEDVISQLMQPKPVASKGDDVSSFPTKD
jgi:regulator of RNase E activity RraB